MSWLALFGIARLFGGGLLIMWLLNWLILRATRLVDKRPDRLREWYTMGLAWFVGCLGWFIYALREGPLFSPDHMLSASMGFMYFTFATFGFGLLTLLADTMRKKDG